MHFSVAHILITQTGEKKKKTIINLKKTDNKCFQYDKCFKL